MSLAGEIMVASITKASGHAFTRVIFYPEKFKIDKRKAHLSDLIFSGQITKHEALAEMQQPIYNETQLKRGL
ncbi:MAG: hypothetical protein IPP11_14660 [Chitinophagaceae bacterium]|nr:hypothetical protein [Chitinophagaceae bacterium]